MRVRAKTEGQLPDQSWVQPGDEFEIADDLVSTKWMEPADGKPWPKSVINAKVNSSAPVASVGSDTLRAQVEAELRAKIEAEFKAKMEAELAARDANPVTENFERIDTDQGEDEGSQPVPSEPPKRGRPKKAADGEDLNDA